MEYLDEALINSKILSKKEKEEASIASIHAYREAIKERLKELGEKIE